MAISNNPIMQTHPFLKTIFNNRHGYKYFLRLKKKTIILMKLTFSPLVKINQLGNLNTENAFLKILY